MSQRRAPRLPWGVVSAIAFLLLLELTVRVGWDPRYVGADLFARYYPGLDFGWDPVKPPCLQSGDDYECYPTPLMVIGRARFPQAKRSDTVRVLVVGSSMAVGDRAYPVVAAEHLRAKCQRADVQLVNLAARGFGARRTARMLQEGELLRPDVVVIDVSGVTEANDAAAERALRDVRESLLGPLMGSRALVLGKRMADKVLDLEVPVVETREQITTASRWDDAVTQRAALDAMLRETAKRRQPVIIVGRGHRHAPTEREQREPRLLRGFEARATALLLGQDVFADIGSDADRARLFRQDDLHYTTEGHRRVGVALAQLLRRKVPVVAQRCPALVR